MLNCYGRTWSFRRLLELGYFDSYTRQLVEQNAIDHLSEYSSIDNSSSATSNSEVLNYDNKTFICSSDQHGNFSISDEFVSFDELHSPENVSIVERLTDNIFQRSDKLEQNVSVHVVSFQYQLQTSLFQTASRLQENGTLFSIEKMTSDLLVAYIFGDGDNCFRSKTNNETSSIFNTGINQRFGTRQTSSNFQSQNRRLETIISISAMPDDEILPGLGGVTCHTDLDSNADRCYIIDGSLTLMGYGDLDWAESYTKLLIKNAMDAGMFKENNEDIVSVDFVSFDPFNKSSTWINITPQHDSSIQSMPPKQTYPENQSGQSARPWILVVLGTTTVLVCCIGVVRRWRVLHAQMKRAQQEIGGQKYNNTKPNTSWSQILPPMLPTPMSNNNTTQYGASSLIRYSLEAENSLDTNVKRFKDNLILVDDNEVISPLRSNLCSTTNSSTRSSELNENHILDPIVVTTKASSATKDENNDSDRSSSLYFEDESDDSGKDPRDFRDHPKQPYHKSGKF